MLLVCLTAIASQPLRAGDAPPWLQALASQRLPAYPAETKAVKLLEERIVSVKPNGEIFTTHRVAYKILLAAGRVFGEVGVPLDNDTKVYSLHGWCIPAQGKDYEVKDKDAYEIGIGFGALYSDDKVKFLKIPASEPGNVIGYEFQQKERSYVLQSEWYFQSWEPVRQARLALELPPGWEFKAYWVNHSETQPTNSGNQWQWVLNDIPAVKDEPDMPPAAAVEGRLHVSFFPSDAAARQNVVNSWQDFGVWMNKLLAGRRDPSPALQQKAKELTASAATPLEKIRALASFVQRDFRYVAIKIGIGGWQPHRAADIFANRYGDCKDKATVLSAMLKEISVDSYYLIVQTDRGVVGPDSPPAFGIFDHVILAIRLPESVPLDSVHALYLHPKLGRLLLFDPTDTITPLGYLPTYLQANYGMLVTEAGGELIALPLLAPSANQLLRTAKLTLNRNGTLTGDVQEVRTGGFATYRRSELLRAEAKDRANVLERLLVASLGGFALTHATVTSLEQYDQPLILNYSFSAMRYAKTAGDLVLIRPRVLGQKSSVLLEIKERTYPVEFDQASEQQDTFEISLPPGLTVDELPPPLEADCGFANYHSKAEFSGGVLRYTRKFQVKEVIVPTAQLSGLKKFYRQVSQDETASAVLRAATQVAR